MTTPYVPEIGQAIFGAPSSEFCCPEWIVAGIRYISEELCTLQWNKTQQKFDDLTGNVGGEFTCPCFELRAYQWNEDDERPNFSCDGFEVRWYKYCGRGTSMNKDITPAEWVVVFDKCVEWINAERKKFFADLYAEDKGAS